MQRTVDDIKERAKYLRDMLAEYADDETVWLDNEDDMEYFKDKLKSFNEINKYQKRLKFKVMDLTEKM